MPLTVRGWRDEDADPVSALSRVLSAPDPAWTPEQARAALTVDALEGGARLRVAERDGTVLGVIGWVTNPPWMFVWPFMTRDPEAAGVLLDAVIAAATPDITTLRSSQRPAEHVKAAVLAERGFAPSFDFVTYRRAPAAGAGSVAPPPGTRVVTGADLDRDALCRLYNDAFTGTPNSAPATRRDLDVLLDGPSAWPGGTAALVAPDHTYAAFLIGQRGTEAGVVEGVGTHAAHRRGGLAAWLLHRALSVAAQEGLPAVDAVIAATNMASVRLHEAAGFTVHARKGIVDLDVTGRA